MYSEEKRVWWDSVKYDIETFSIEYNKKGQKSRKTEGNEELFSKTR